MRSILGMLFALSLLAAAVTPAAAQSYPTKPVRLIIPYASGGSSDYVGRLVAIKLSEAWGQQVLPDNRPGANGNIGVEFASKAEADGYTLLLASEIQFVINPAAYKNLRQDLLKDFEPITLIGVAYNLLIANGALPLHDTRDLVSYAKSHPGKVNYASPGTASPNHLAMALLSMTTGAPMVHVPYKSTGQAMPDILSGQVQVMLTTIPAALPYMNTGKIRVLGVGAPQRLAALPDTPTIAEGGFPGFESSVAWSLFAPAGTPRRVIERVQDDVAKMLAQADVRDKFTKIGLTPMASTPAELLARLKNDQNKWPKLIREAGIQVSQ